MADPHQSSTIYRPPITAPAVSERTACPMNSPYGAAGASLVSECRGRRRRRRTTIVVGTTRSSATPNALKRTSGAPCSSTRRKFKPNAEARRHWSIAASLMPASTISTAPSPITPRRPSSRRNGTRHTAIYVHFRRADFATALTAFDAAIALDAEDSSNHAGRCETLAAQQNFEEAEAACAEALRLASDEAYPHIANGYLRFAQGRFDEAWTAFDRGVQLDEDRAIAVYARGVSAVRLGRQAEGDADIALARGRSLRAISLYANAGMLP
jgi:hypothetical protein